MAAAASLARPLPPELAAQSVLELCFDLAARMDQAAEADHRVGGTTCQREHAVAARGVVAMRDFDPVLALGKIKGFPVTDPAHRVSIAIDPVHGDGIARLDATSNQACRFKDDHRWRGCLLHAR